MNQWIVSDRNIYGGKPIVRGTRIMVMAALEYAAQVIDEEQVVCA